MNKVISIVIWCAVAVMGAGAYAALAMTREEPINSIYILVAALCSYAIGYRFYSKWIAARILGLNDRRATPCNVHDDGRDFVKTNYWIVFGHHFAAISGPGPLVGPVLAAQFGYLPGTLWILIGVVLGGAVQDMVILFASMRRDGKSLAQMVREELNTTAGVIGMAGILSIMIVLLAVLALVVVNALAESPWGVFTVGATIPIALLMGGYLRFLRVGKVLEISILGGGMLLLAVWGGQFVHTHKAWSDFFTLRASTIAGAVIFYGLAASVLPVWLLLAPRDYLSTFLKLGTIFALALGTFLVLPTLKMPAVSKFVDGSGLVIPGSVFPFCFITIACGAISGFHTMISSGTTPKIITRERYARPIGYGAMCLESLVAIMAMIAACSLDPGVYLSMNVKGTGPDAATIAADIKSKVEKSGFLAPQRDSATKGFRMVPITVSTSQMDSLAEEVKEKTLYGRTGGAATLAVGMASIFASVTRGHWLDLWYHFAIMFEALFILTTLDAGTRVGRYLLHDILGHLWKPLRDTRNIGANLFTSSLIVSGWGFFVIQGVRDPEGGVKALWPVFGIANQMLAAIAFCLATTIILKSQLLDMTKPAPGQAEEKRGRKPALALVTSVPLAWLLAVTMTAGVQKIFHPDKGIGFMAAAAALEQAYPDLKARLNAASASGAPGQIEAAKKAIAANRIQHFNSVVDTAVTAVFLTLVGMIVVLSAWEWTRLLAGRTPAQLRETPPVWLPEPVMAGGRAVSWVGRFALLLALAKEMTGEAALDRAEQAGFRDCQVPTHPNAQVNAELLAEVGPVSVGPRGELYAKIMEQKYSNINRCC